ncbi:MAG: hypothetical protein R2726_00745 [Acidimicrobiales bacterium]
MGLAVVPGALAVVFAVVAAGLAVGFVGVPAKAAESKGNANMLYWPSSPWRIVYGQDLHIEVRPGRERVVPLHQPRLRPPGRLP